MIVGPMFKITKEPYQQEQRHLFSRFHVKNMDFKLNSEYVSFIEKRNLSKSKK